MKQIFKTMVNDNPLFVLMLGLCPALAVTTNFESAYMMGLCFLIVVVISNVIISVIKKLVPDNVRIPVYILIIGTVVTILEILLSKYLPKLSEQLGVYLSLIVVNCVVLGRALSVASKKNIAYTLKDSIGIGLGFTISLMLIGAIREILGTNTITFMSSLSELTGYRAVYKVYPDMNLLPNPIFTSGAGAFLVLGFLMALFNSFKKEENHESD
ncbi:MAG: electron transport complex subunit RsxE [Bacilli bacterium]|nr:electron transport complex subunit RsxE [Bacilli bacterium]